MALHQIRGRKAARGHVAFLAINKNGLFQLIRIHPCWGASQSNPTRQWLFITLPLSTQLITYMAFLLRNRKVVCHKTVINFSTYPLNTWLVYVNLWLPLKTVMLLGWCKTSRGRASSLHKVAVRTNCSHSDVLPINVLYIVMKKQLWNFTTQVEWTVYLILHDETISHTW